jgi:DeoR/GlpR family transcriptional regulator of sugar metabolism
MAAQGLVQRVHGGALPASPAVGTLAARAGLVPEAKVAIGRAAAALIRAGQTVLLDGGTTAIQLARHLPPGLRATIVTHSPLVAAELAAHGSIEIVLIGGVLFRHSMVACGALAVEAIGRVRADLSVLGVTGVHPEIGLTTGDADEAAVKRALIRASGETIVLASREKLGAASAHVIAPLDAVDTLVVERGLPDDRLRPFAETGVGLVRA